MHKEWSIPEVLSPAGSMESLRAAVSAGCDAVYIGGSRFGARAYADNPGTDEMRRAIEYCHRYDRKIYMTVNTLLKEQELEDSLFDYMEPYVREGLDAAIVQDIGVMALLHEAFPDLDLHASTQMTITQGETGHLLQDYGVTRMVPARELTLAELEQMRKDTGLELEVFVHGALCYCYSGQCLFSSMLGDRSGNRGRCAQPCRQAYRVTDLKGVALSGEHGPYVLSPRENGNLALVPDLMLAGVDSLKIEGRMKRPEYVAAVTAAYRRQVDLASQRGPREYREYSRTHPEQLQKELQTLGELYNRQGFTRGYLMGEAGVPILGHKEMTGKTRPAVQGTMLADRRPNHGGILVGKVLSVDRHTATYEALQDIDAQDVVEFRTKTEQTAYEYTLGQPVRAGQKVTARYQKGSVIRVGDPVYRTRHTSLLERIRNDYLEQDPKLSVDMEFEAGEDAPMELVVSCRGISARVQGQLCQRAQKQSADVESVRRVLCQTGDTCFEAASCEVHLEGELFLPVGALKKLRRQALEELLSQLSARSGPEKRTVCTPKTVGRSFGIPNMSGADGNSLGNLIMSGVEGNDMGNPDTLGAEGENRRYAGETGAAGNRVIVSVMTQEQWQCALEQGTVTDVIGRMDAMSPAALEDWAGKTVQAGKRVWIALPRILRRQVQEYFRSRANTLLFSSEDIAGYYIANLESWEFLTRDLGVAPERICLDAGIYVMNRRSAAWWMNRGVCHMTMPLELTGREGASLMTVPGMEMIVYGRTAVMVSAQCVRANLSGCRQGGRERWLMLQDQKNRRFVVYQSCEYCYNLIYQDDPLCLTGYWETLAAQGIRNFRFDFTTETPGEMERALRKEASGQEGHYRKGVL